MRTLTLIISLLLTAVPAAFTQTSTPAGERTTVDLTIYNSNLALVHEQRSFPLVKGINQVIVPDIPATIDGTSLHFTSLTDPAAVRVLEQNFQYDLISQSKMLEKYLGREVEFVRLDDLTKKEYTVRGKLLSAGLQGGGMIAEINGKVELNPPGRIVLPPLTDGLVLKPQLAWMLNTTRPGTHKTEISYLAGQISWNCNYVAVLNAADNRVDLTGWVTLTNNSGTTFRDAGLKLVAGDVNRVQEQVVTAQRAFGKMAMMDAAAPQFAQTELFEYKLYALQRRTDVANNETKQIELTSGANIPARKVFVYDGVGNDWRWWRNNYSYRDQGSFGQQSDPKVGVYVIFRNAEASGLGLPLPKGSVRVYKKDADGQEQFVGEDRIDHTPKDEEVKLYLGNAFDIVGSRAQKEFRVVVTGHVYEETFEIRLRNHKTEAVEVEVYEHPWRASEWDIKKSSDRWDAIDQSTIRFPIRLKKDEEKIVSYTIRYSW